jgi:hypothetical protein
MAVWQTGLMKTKTNEPGTMVKTTLRLPQELWRNIRMRALSEGRDAQSIVAAALEMYLKKPRPEGAR